MPPGAYGAIGVRVVSTITFFSVDIPNGFSVTTTLIFHKKDLAERVWLEDLHTPVTNSETGGEVLPVLCWPHSALVRDGR